MSLHQFTLESNPFLQMEVNAYYILDYVGYQQPNNPDFISHLKNSFYNNEQEQLEKASEELASLLKEHQQELTEMMNREDIHTFCIVPRSKKRDSYQTNQLLFWHSIKQFFQKNYSYPYGDIVRHTDTRTTHLDKSGYGGDGELPYVGITQDTCTIHTDEIRGKNILLIDDIYTKTVNINEDCLQALLDKGAKKVVLFTIARTYYRYNRKRLQPFYYQDAKTIHQILDELLCGK